MPACPVCEETDKQYFHAFTPGTTEAPPEEAHYECMFCGCTYDEDPGAEIDGAMAR